MMLFQIVARKNLEEIFANYPDSRFNIDVDYYTEFVNDIVSEIALIDLSEKDETPSSRTMTTKNRIIITYLIDSIDLYWEDSMSPKHVWVTERVKLSDPDLMTKIRHYISMVPK